MRRVTITATPADAQITIDGQPAGTGQVVRDLAVGTTVTVRVSRAGYDPLEQRVRVEATTAPLALRLQRTRQSVTIEPTPATSTVFVDNQRVGTGTVTVERAEGDRISVRVEAPGHQPAARDVVVAANLPPLRLQLERLIRTSVLRASVTPANAQVFVNGQPAGTGQLEREFAVDQEVQLRFALEGYQEVSRTVRIASPQPPIAVTLERLTVSVRIVPIPADARVTVNGMGTGTGPISQRAIVGAQLQIRVDRDGYRAEQRTVTVDREDATFEVRLQPQPLERTVRIGTGALVRAIIADGSMLFASDAAGTVYALTATGEVRWRVATANQNNENSVPVVAGNRVYFSGAAELVVIDRETGRVVNRRELGGTESHLFGRRVVPWANGTMLPVDQGILLLDRDGNPSGRTLPIAGGVMATPAVVGQRIYIADQQGTIHVIDPADGRSIAQIPTGMSQPIAHAPAVTQDRLVFVGRRGTVSAIDPNTNRVVWEETVPGGTGSFVDPVVVGTAVYVYARNEVSAFNLSDGRLLFGPIARVASAPSRAQRRAPGVPPADLAVVGHADGRIELLEPNTGRRVAGLTAAAAVTATPAAVGRLLVFGLATGDLVFVHPDGVE